MNQDNPAGPSSPQAIADAFDLAKSPRPQSACRKGAQFIGAFSNVLDLGAAGPELIQALPEGCDYRNTPLGPDEAGGGGDLGQVSFRNGGAADVVTLLDGLERCAEPLALLRRLRALGRPLVFSYAAPGGASNPRLADLEAMLRDAGFWLQHKADLGDGTWIGKAVPGVAPAPPRPRKVLVLSYFNDANFGDRLGFHVVNGLAPAGTVVTHASVRPWTVPDERFDLLILGIGNSLNAATVARPELHRLVESVPHTLGVFGTQYRHQYRQLIDPRLLDRLLGNLTTWWARYEEDILAFGRGRNNVRPLGDVLISAFPLATPSDRRTLRIDADIRNKDVPLDRLIQQIQTYRRVSSARIHPMLCALTSAEQVAFQEQHEDPSGQTSGKFRSQLYDIFGRTFDENAYFPVDRAAVARYKLRVEANMGDLRAQISQLLA